MSIYQNRVKKLYQLLEKEECNALLVEDQVNLFYLTGLHLSAGQLIIDKESAELVVDGRYYERCLEQSPFPVRLAKSSDSLPQKRVGFNSGTTTYSRFLQLKKRVKELIPLDNPIEKLRMIKDLTEINTLREAAKLGSEGFDFVLSILKENITEAEVALELEIFWRKKGGERLAFDPIIAFGANSSMPHYRAGNVKLKKGSPVLIDIGVTDRHYHSDMTRVVYFGEPDPKMSEIHQIVQEAQQLALDFCRPKTPIGKLDKAARDFIADKGYGENFTHSLGHGIGLEVHEPPTIRNSPPFNEMTLEEGMVITIEPGIYLPGVGGVRIEDTVVITSKGHENLTNRPKDSKLLINLR